MGKNAVCGNNSPNMNKDYEILKLKKVEVLEQESTLLKISNLLESRPCVRSVSSKSTDVVWSHQEDMLTYGSLEIQILQISGPKKSNRQIEHESLGKFVGYIFNKHTKRQNLLLLSKNDFGCKVLPPGSAMALSSDSDAARVTPSSIALSTTCGSVANDPPILRKNRI